MINKIRQFFGMKQKYIIDGVDVYLPHSPSTILYVEMRAKILPPEKSRKIVKYLIDEGFVSEKRPKMVMVKLK
jgi:hypothetical protein